MCIPDDNTSMSAIVGKAGHLALQTYFGGNENVVIMKGEDPAQLAIQAGLDWIDKMNDNYIRYGKTGSREELLKRYGKAINWYIDEMPVQDWEIVSVEESISAPMKYVDSYGKETEMAIPMKAKLDILMRYKGKATDDKNAPQPGELWLIDHKFVTSYTDPDEESAIKVIQAMFQKKCVEHEHKEVPAGIMYRECKVTKNMKPDPVFGWAQTHPWGIRFSEVPHYESLFARLYDDCTKSLIRPDIMFLPNVRDMMNGAESFLLYKQNLLGSDMSDVEIDHNTHHVRYQMKESSFNASTLDTADSDSYPPEERVRVKLGEFGIPVKSGEVNHGPSVTLYTFTPSRGVSVNRVEKHAKDIALALKAESVRIIAPIPGTNNIGIEVAREDREIIEFTDSLLEMNTFNVPMGVDLYGKVIRKDLRKMPHMLVSGATGAGKSVFINTVIKSLTTQNSPDIMRMVLIDPKQVELAHWEGDAHMDDPVIYNVSGAISKLQELTEIMDARYTTLRKAGAKSIEKYSGNMPYILVVIDEFADLIMSKEKIKTNDALGRSMEGELFGSQIENTVVRLAQKGRAAGIHLVIGTQKPIVKVLTGLIKANIPTRVAFMCTSHTDSQVIIDTKGAEELLGAGDMLFQDPSTKGLQRLQGFYLD